MTKLGIHTTISGNGNIFNKQKIWNQNQEQKSCKSKKDEYRDPTIYFSMVIYTEVNPQELIDRITHKWAWLNRTRLHIKDLQSIESETVVTFFKVFKMTPKAVTLAELWKILLEAQRRGLDNLLDTSTYDFTLDDGI
jgi:hypothetical protein